MSNWHGGKGSKQRPTDKKKYEDNWDRIFGKKEELPSAVDDAADVSSKYAHPAYTRYPHLKDLDKALEELNDEIHGKKK
jgi:hypothetical protein